VYAKNARAIANDFTEICESIKGTGGVSSSAPVGAMKDDVGLGWPSGMRASGTLSDSDGAAAG